MGSSKKHKEKDKDKEEGSASEKKEKSHKKKHRDRDDPDKDKEKSRKDKEHKKKHKDKRKHSQSEDSDAPVQKSARYSGGGSGNSSKDDQSPQKAQLSMSIDDTNRMREKLGLKPLQIESSSKPKRRSPSPPPLHKTGNEASLSIDETNKLRIKLGLKPLQTSSAPGSSQKVSSSEPIEEGETLDEDFDEETLERIKAERGKEAQEFWKEKQDFVHAPAESITQERAATKLREKIATQREKRRIEGKLLAKKGLGDSDSDDDASAWVMKTKKIEEEKALAQKRAKALDELDNEFGVGDLVESAFVKKKNKAYDSKDLKGIKVMHSQDRIQEGESVIMTLDDKDVLDEKDDVLVNVNMIDDEKFEKNIQDRRLRPELHGYNVFDELSGFDDQGMPKAKQVLSKYDEEISGVERKTFVIGEDNQAEVRRAKLQERAQKANKILESITAPDLIVASDFLSQEEMSFKKRTKKVRKVRKKLRADDLLKDEFKTSHNLSNDTGSRSRKNAGAGQEKNVLVKTEPVDMDIDLEVDDLPPAPEVDISDIKIEDEGDLDFQLALSKQRKLKQKEKVVKPSVEKMADLIRSHDSDMQDASESKGAMMFQATAEFCRTLGDIPSFGGDDIYANEEMDFETEEAESRAKDSEERGNWNEVDIDETPVDVSREQHVEKVAILEQEPEIGSGLAGALKLAMKKGYLEHEKAKPSAAPKMKHLQAKNYSIEDKNYEDERIPSKRDMYSGPVVEFKEKDHYRPEVKLEYNDDEGQPISAKEAFRLLSHKFHGKGSGKNKIDKKRRKFEQEKLHQHMSSTDTPLGTLDLLQQRQKLAHTPYIVLTGSKAAQSSSLSKISKR